MRKLHLYIIFIGSFFWLTPAWSQYFPTQQIDLSPIKDQNDLLSPHHPFLINLDELYHYVQQQGEDEPFSLQFKMDDQLWDLKVWRSNLLHPTYELITTGKGKTQWPGGQQLLFLKGRIVGEEEVNIALTINGNFLFGQIGDLLIEPAAPYFEQPLASNALISYYDWEISGLPEVFCGSKEEAKDKVEDLLGASVLEAKTQRAGECYTVEFAIAADYLALLQIGDVYLLQNYYLGILNMVRLTYDDEFSDEFRFAVRGFYVVDCEGCDPWTASTEARDLLASFRDWGNAGGFGFNYDLASMWTGRILNDSLAGLGYLSVVCENRRYHVLRNYTSNIGLLRTLQAHEIGHNFSARHDEEEAPYIMAPAIQDIDVWSEASLSKVESYVRLLVAQKEWCLGGCSPPEAAFEPPMEVGCAPLQVQFVDASIGEVTAWQWVFEGGIANADFFPNPLVLYPQAGVFGAELWVSNASGVSVHVEDTVAIVKDLPLAAFDRTVDTAQLTVQFQFTGSEALSYTWQFGDGEESQESYPDHIYADYGEYQVQLIVTNECGADTSMQTVVLPPPLQAAFQPRESTGCAPLSVQFFDQSSGEPTSRQWSFRGGAPESSTEAAPLVRYDQPGVYGVHLFVQNADMESEYVEESAVVVQGMPGADFISEIDQAERRVQFQFIGGNADSFSWQFGDGTQSQEENPVHIYGDRGDFEVELTVSNDCGMDVYRQTIHLLAPAEAGFSADVTEACAPFSVNFTDLSQGEVATYKWTFPGGQPGASSDPSPTVQYTQPGTYRVRLEVSNAAGADTLIRESYMHVLPGPEARFEVGGGLGDTVFVFINDSFDARSYEWQFGDGQSSGDFVPSHYYEQDGDYLTQLVAINECGRDTVQAMISVLRSPKAAMSISRRQGCLPLNVQFEDQSYQTIAERQWFFPGGMPAQSSEAEPQVLYAEPGSYDVILIVRNATGMDTLLYEGAIQVGEKVVADFNVSVEPGDTILSFENNSQNAQNYLWQFGDGEQSTEPNPVHFYAEDGIFTVQLISESDCGRDTSLQAVEIIRPITADFIVVSQTGCSAKTILFEDRSIGTIEERNWIFEGGTPASSDLANPVVVFNQPGYYSVTLKVENAAGEQVVEKKNLIYVPESPTARFIYDYQLGDSTVRFQNLSEQSTTYLWDFGDGQQSTEAEPAHTYREDGEYTIKLEAQNECKTSLMLTQITVATMPQADFRSDVSIGCAPFTVQFESMSSENTHRLSWEFPGGQPHTAQSPNPLVTYALPGLYDVILKASNPAGEVMEEKKEWIAVESLPAATFQFEQNGPNLQFENLSAEANTFRWDFGDGQSSQDQSPSHDYQTSGDYEVQLIAFNNCGADTTRQTLSVIINDTKTPVWRAMAKLFPNPNTGRFTLQLGSLPSSHTRLRLWNSLGQLIQVTYWDNALSTIQWLEVPEAKAGLYLLEVASGKEKGYWRVLVVKND